MHLKTRRALAAASVGIVSALTQHAGAQVVDYFGGTYLQNFDALPSSGATAVQLPNTATVKAFDLTQPLPNGVGAGQALTGWYASKFIGTGTGANLMQFYTTDGSNVQASIGSLGSLGAAGDFDRALGSFSNTGSEQRFGMVMTNDTDTPFTKFTLEYDVEQWSRVATTVDFLNRLEYAVGATDINTGAFKNIGPTDQTAGGGTWNSIVQGANAALNGNDPANKRHKSFQITGINWQPGQTLVIRWNDVNDANVDSALGIDNVSFTADIAGKILTWKGNPNGVWDTNAGNQPWVTNTNAPSAFTAGDIVNFPATLQNAAINVDAAGVTPTSITMSHPANTYLFGGGPIGGDFTQNGAGNTVFTGPNNFTSADIEAGVVEIQTNGGLGTGNTVTLGNGTIKITSTDHDFANALLVTGNGTIDTSVPLTISGSVNGTAGTTLTIKNSSNQPVLVHDFNTAPSLFAGNLHIAKGVVKYSGTNDGDLFGPSTIVTVDAGATLDMGINGDSFGGIQGGGNIILTDTPGSFLNLQAAGDRTFSGIISGTTVNATSLGLHQQGGGVLTLTGKSTFKAPTTISFGTIVVGGDVLPDTDGPLGNSSTAITIGDGGASTSAVVGLLIAGPHEVARKLTIPSNTNTVAITLGGTTDDNSVFSGDIDMGKSPRLTSVTTGNNAVTFSGALLASGANAHGITKIGTGLVILSSPNNSYLNPTTINEGTLRVTGSIASSAGVVVNTGGTFEAGATQRIQALTVNNGGKAKALKGVLTIGNGTTASPLTVETTPGSTATIDVMTNGMVIDYPAGSEASTLATVRALIIKGYNASAPGAGDGDWKGPGITSSSAGGNKAVGYAQATEALLGPGNTFMGVAVDDTSLLVRYTLNGDSNLDGAVGFADLVAVAQHYGTSDGSANWAQGDFNFDGNVGFADLVAVAQNYGGTLPAAASIPGAPAKFANDVAAAFASVPEPSMLSLLGVGLAAMTRRRRR